MSYYDQPESQFGYFNPRQIREGGTFHEYFDPERIRASTDTTSPAQEDDAFPVPGVWGM